MNYPLPVELLSFSSSCENNNIELKWVTASETNNDYFTVERSPDAINWQVVTTINGAGNSNTVLNYNTTDTNPLEGISYYRLKQTDYNGDYTYSGIIAISCQENVIEIINIYPNPASDCFNYIIYSKEDKEISVCVTDALGVVVISKKENITKELNHKSLDVSGLAAAPYYLKVETLDGLSKDSKQILVK